jgi:hypothetical protein
MASELQCLRRWCESTCSSLVGCIRSIRCSRVFRIFSGIHYNASKSVTAEGPNVLPQLQLGRKGRQSSPHWPRSVQGPRFHSMRCHIARDIARQPPRSESLKPVMATSVDRDSIREVQFAGVNSFSCAWLGTTITQFRRLLSRLER